MTPLEKISVTLSFVIYFAHCFQRKMMNGLRKFCHRKNFKKKYMGGPPNHRTRPKSKKIFQRYKYRINNTYKLFLRGLMTHPWFTRIFQKKNQKLIDPHSQVCRSFLLYHAHDVYKEWHVLCFELMYTPYN